MKKRKLNKRPLVAEESDEDSDEDEKLIRVNGPNVYFYASVSKKTMLDLIAKLDEATVNAIKNTTALVQPKVYLYIHSSGGDAFVGLSAMAHIQNRPIPVVTIADGFVASAASLILLSVKERYILPNTHILIHQLRTMFWGKYEELLDEVTNSKLLMEAIVHIYKKETTIPHKKLGELLKKEINLSAQQCIKCGLVNDILPGCV